MGLFTKITHKGVFLPMPQELEKNGQLQPTLFSIYSLLPLPKPTPCPTPTNSAKSIPVLSQARLWGSCLRSVTHLTQTSDS